LTGFSSIFSISFHNFLLSIDMCRPWFMNNRKCTNLHVFLHIHWKYGKKVSWNVKWYGKFWKYRRK
jgi:hypothetical protein